MLALPKRYSLDLKLDVACVPDPDSAADPAGDEDPEDFGTADALRLVRDRLTSPRVLVAPCDLVTDFRVQHLADLHRVRSSALTALLVAEDKSSATSAATPVPGPKTKRKRERDLVGIDESRLLLVASEADLEESLSLRRSTLLEHPKLTVRSDLQDAHLYVLEKWVVDYLQENKE